MLQQMTLKKSLGQPAPSTAEAAVRFVSSVKTAKSSVSKRITQELPAHAPCDKIPPKSAPVSEAALFANVSTLTNA